MSKIDVFSALESIAPLSEGMTCQICASFVHDWMMRPFRPDDILYKDIYHRRLSHVTPKAVPILARFLEEISEFQLEMALANMKIDIILTHSEDPVVIERAAWSSVGKWFSIFDEFEEIAILLEEHCVFKGDIYAVTDAWLGYCLCNLACVKDVHREHSGTRRISDDPIGPVGHASPKTIEEELYG